MFRTREDVVRYIGHQASEHEHTRNQWRRDKQEAGLLLACAQGISGAISANPDCFSPYVFTINDAAAALAAWIQSQPRR